MPFTAHFDTPGSLRDLPAGHRFYDDWHATVANLIAPDVTPGNPRGDFFDPSVFNLDLAGERNLTWMGFPRKFMTVAFRDSRGAAFGAGENRAEQDEYLEWHVTKRAGKITKVVFVTETPEYWRALAAAAPEVVLTRYRELVDPAVTRAELFSGPGSTYNPGNVWNTERGIVHYVQRINTLRDAVGLSIGSISPGPPQDNFEAPSTAQTAADPRVALDIGVLARKGLSVALRDPVGLYMADWDDTGWTKPNGRPVGNYWRVRRGAPGAALRLEYEVPPSEGFVVGDIRIGGRPIEFGGQIAEHVTVTTAGVAGTRRP